jgi:hypothetical protein
MDRAPTDSRRRIINAQATLGGAAPALAPEQPTERRGVDDAGHRLSMLDQRDVDGELAVARQKLLGPVERIDEEEALRRP